MSSQWARQTRARLIYYYYNKRMPLYLLTIFKRNEKIDLKQDEKHELSKLAELLRNT